MIASQLWLIAYRRGFRHPVPLIRPVDQREDRLGHARGWIGQIDQDSRCPGLDRLPHASGPHADHWQPRSHRLEYDVPESLRPAGKREDVRGRVVVGQVLPFPIAHELGKRPDPALEDCPRRAVADQQYANARPL